MSLLLTSLVLWLMKMNYAWTATAFVLSTPSSADRAFLLSSSSLIKPRSSPKIPCYKILITLQRMKEEEDDDTSDTENDGDDVDDDETNNNYLTYEELQRDPELRRKEQEASDKRDALFNLPRRISQAVTFTGWLFIGVAFLLEANGYAFVSDPNSGRITVDTLERRNFLKEVKKQEKQQQQEATVSMLHSNTNALLEQRND